MLEAVQLMDFLESDGLTLDIKHNKRVFLSLALVKACWFPFYKKSVSHQVNKVIYPGYFLWWSILKLLHGKQWWHVTDLFGVEVKLKLFLQFLSDFHASRPSVPELAATQVHWNFTFIVSLENRISLEKRYQRNLLSVTDLSYTNMWIFLRDF